MVFSCYFSYSVQNLTGGHWRRSLLYLRNPGKVQRIIPDRARKRRIKKVSGEKKRWNPLRFSDCVTIKIKLLRNTGTFNVGEKMVKSALAKKNDALRKRTKYSNMCPVDRKRISDINHLLWFKVYRQIHRQTCKKII